MYLTSASILSIRAISSLVWRLGPKDSRAGWHVIVGENGSGKTSFLRAIALALVGPRTSVALRLPWAQWLSHGEDFGRIRIALVRDPEVDRFSGSGRTARGSELGAVVSVDADDDPVLPRGHGAERHLWGKGDGWFSASYGPFRRFRGGDPEYKKIFYSYPKLGRHLTLFDESVALSECLEWLQSLKFKELEEDPEARILEPLIAFINQDGFLPFHAKLTEITSSAVRFVDGNGAQVEVENLSDGYRSILSLTFELIRQMVAAYGPDAIFDPDDPTKVRVPGVVLIDEIDAHLHPTWQRRIGTWFREHFPRVQFIVTTHSPIICQAAEPGTVFRLPRPGVEERGRFVRGDELKRLIHGSIQDAYGTEVFGDGVTRSKVSRDMLDELAALNVKELQHGLGADERDRQRELRKILPSTAYEAPAAQ